MRTSHRWLVLLVLSVLGGHVYAADVITAAQAKDHIGEAKTVRGVVVSAKYSDKAKGAPTFLNLDKPYPDAIFTVLIWGSDRSKFTGPPEKQFLGKTIFVTGTIMPYMGTAEIVVSDPKQITIEDAPKKAP